MDKHVERILKNEMMSVSAAARFISRTSHEVRQMIDHGRMGSSHDGRLVSRFDLQRWLDRHRPNWKPKEYEPPAF